MELITGRDYDNLVGSTCTCVVAGECALQRCGLTSYMSNTIQAWTLYPEISGCHNSITAWYFSPFYNKYFDTNPSPVNSNILEPTRERALIEYILFREYFDEGILIEGLKSYLFLNDGNVEPLFEEAKKFSVPAEEVEYWLNEARNDEDY